MLLKKSIIIYFITSFVFCNSEIYSYLHQKSASLPPFLVHQEIENLCVKYINEKETEKDLICTLNKGKKIAICQEIYQLQTYINKGVYMNKTVFYLGDVSCRNKRVVLVDHSKYKGKIFKQAMYPCYGRHKVVRTSFIEDDYYDLFYLSSSMEPNSIVVYICKITPDQQEWCNIHDYIFNFYFFVSPDITTTVNEAVEELKLNKKVVWTNNYMALTEIFFAEQNSISDRISNLEYEKKITLCSIVLKEIEQNNQIQITLNKSATYVFDMEYVINKVQVSTNFASKNLIIYQKMYPCYARKNTAVVNLLTDKFIKKYFISKGPRRNSVFVYYETNQGIFLILGLLENINIQHLKPTFTSEEEIMEESKSTFKNILQIMNSVEKKASNLGLLSRLGGSAEQQKEKDLEIFRLLSEVTRFIKNKIDLKMLQIKEGEIIETINPENENKLIKNIEDSSKYFKNAMEMKDNETEVYADIFNTDEKVPDELNIFQNLEIKSQLNKIDNDEYISDIKKFIQSSACSNIGPQIIQILREKKRKELNNELIQYDEEITSKIIVKSTKKKSAADSKFWRANSIKKKVQELIADMEKYILTRGKK